MLPVLLFRIKNYMILSFKRRVEGPPYDNYKNVSLSIKKTPKILRSYFMHDFGRKNLIKMKNAFYNYFDEIFDTSLY